MSHPRKWHTHRTGRGLSDEIAIQLLGFRTTHYCQQGHQEVRKRTTNATDTPAIYLFVSRRYILHAKKTAFVIEHDFIMATYLADRVIVFEGQPAVSATALP